MARARKVALDRLMALGLTPWITPRGGFYLWCRLPAGMDSTAIARSCREMNVVLAPGNVFSVSETAGEFLRSNVAHLDDERVFNALQQAMRAERSPS
ncbi:aminotransferase class I/II-fold pyridoxal phosphate-dependent enzyme [Klebsiella variicola]